jgi:hypothetical protein
MGLNSLELAIEIDRISEQQSLHSDPHWCASWLLSSAVKAFLMT